MSTSVLALAPVSSPVSFHAVLGAAPAIAGVRLEFVLFGLTLLGVALFHHKTLQVAATGAVAITAYRLAFTDFDLLAHAGHESMLLLNLFGLLVGFAVLAEYFKESKVPEMLPAILPDDWKGGFLLLVMVFVLSSFLDNIAAAMIGGTIAGVVFQKRVHVGYLAAIVAASNAGGSGSVVGDTTTTMMWIGGKSPLDVFHAYVAAVPALIVFGIVASLQQDRVQRILRDSKPGLRVDWARVGIVGLILALTIVANTIASAKKLDLPAAAIGLWTAIAIGWRVRRPAVYEIPIAAKGALFLLCLVWCASMMPVEELPAASWPTALGLGFVSAVFDNIPLTKLALDQGGYDWGVLAYAVGFGGSMIWFGSSAGVAMSSLYPGARSVGAWLKNGWHVAVAYVIGFFVMLALWGWHPHD